MKQIDTGKLDDIIQKVGKTATERILYRDVFAVACYLHQVGQRQAGEKVIQTLFDQLGRNMRTTYFGNLVSNLSDNEERFALGVCAHLEVKKLFSSDFE